MGVTQGRDWLFGIETSIEFVWIERLQWCWRGSSTLPAPFPDTCTSCHCCAMFVTVSSHDIHLHTTAEDENPRRHIFSNSYHCQCAAHRTSSISFFFRPPTLSWCCWWREMTWNEKKLFHLSFSEFFFRLPIFFLLRLLSSWHRYFFLELRKIFFHEPKIFFLLSN